MSKISELSDGGSLVSSDYLIAVRSGGNVKVRMNQINVDQVDLGDNEFIRLGNSQDLTMVHTSTQSIINQAGIGDLLIQKAGATKLTINASGIDVTGSVTADGLTVDDTSGIVGLFNSTAVASTLAINNTHANAWGSNIAFRTGGTDAGYFGSIGSLLGNTDQDLTAYSTAGNGFRIYTNGNNERLRVTSAGSVGIGTTSPPEGFAIGATSSVAGFSIGSGDTQVFLRYNNYFSGTAQVSDATKGAASISLGRGSDGVITFNTAAAGAGVPTEAARIDSSGDLNLVNSGLTSLNFTTDGSLDYARITGGKSGSGVGELQFWTYSGGISRAATIDKDGNLLVGTLSTNPYTSATETGAVVRGDEGILGASRSAGASLRVNRVGTGGTENGDIAEFRSNGAVVGSIGVASSDNMYITSSATNHVGLYLGGGGVLPMNSGSLDTGDNVDIGSPNYQFADLHLAGGVVFGATGGAVASKTLDDYEEGTWQPVYTSTTNAADNVNNSRVGYYTKVGNMVYATASLFGNDLSGITSTDQVRIDGLPFTSSNTSAGNDQAVTVGQYRLLLTTDHTLLVPNNTTHISVTTDGFVAATYATFFSSTASTLTSLKISLVYQAA